MKHKKYKTWEDITDVLTPEGFAAVEVGQVLIFSQATLKVMHKTKSKVWAKEVRLFTPEEVEVMDKQ